MSLKLTISVTILC